MNASLVLQGGGLRSSALEGLCSWVCGRSWEERPGPLGSASSQHLLQEAFLTNSTTPTLAHHSLTKKGLQGTSILSASRAQNTGSQLSLASPQASTSGCWLGHCHFFQAMCLCLFLLRSAWPGLSAQQAHRRQALAPLTHFSYTCPASPPYIQLPSRDSPAPQSSMAPSFPTHRSRCTA